MQRLPVRSLGQIVVLVSSAGLLVAALFTLFGSERAVLIPEYRAFFAGVPRPLWGLIQTAAALFGAWTVIAVPKYRLAAAYVIAVCWLVWAGASVYQAVHSRQWNAVAVTALITLAVITVAAGFAGRPGRARWSDPA